MVPTATCLRSPPHIEAGRCCRSRGKTQLNVAHTWSHGRCTFSRPVQLRLQHCRRRHLCRPSAAAGESEEVDVEADALERMDKTLETVRRDFSTVRTGRANPSILDRIEVEYYGAMTPLKALAGISIPDSSSLVISPYDKASIPDIERAIMESDLNMTPGNDGNVIRLNVPQLTAERRKEMGKLVSKLGEEGKVAIRNVRRDCMRTIDALEKKGDLTEDDKKLLSDSVQELTDDHVKQIDALIKSKQDDLAKV